VYSPYGISSLSSIVSYGLSTVYSPYGISSLSSIVSYSISSFSSIIGQTFTTSSLFTNYISSGVADFSTISTQTILVGDPNAPARIDIGLISPYVSSTSLRATNAYIISGLGVGKPAPYWYVFDVSGNTRITSIEVSSISGDGSGLSNLNIPGISSLSSIVSYGLSTIYSPYGISSLSSIVSYGLSTIYSPYGISSLSSIVSYGLSSLGGAAGTGVSSLSSIVSYGLSTIYSPYGISSLSSIVSYGLSTVYSPYGISSLSSIVSYGLSTVYSPYGVSSLSSIVSYGLSTVYSPYGVSSLSSIVSYGLSTVYSPYGISSLSSIVSYSISSFSSIIGQTFTTSSLFTNYISSGVADFSTISTQTILVGDPNAPGIVNIGLITPYNSSIFLTTTNAYITSGLGVGKPAPYWYVFDVSGNTRITSIEVSSISGDGSGLSNLNIPGISSLSSIVSYGLSTVYSPYGISSLSSIVSYGLSTVYSPYGISSLSSIVSYGLSTVYSPYGISSLSSIVSYGLSTVGLIGNGTFKANSIGGIGISSVNCNVGGADSLTTAIQKTDDWIFTNLIGQSPFPGSCNFAPNSNSNYAVFSITPPFQFKTGFLNRWLPYISTLNVTLTDRNNNTVMTFPIGNRNYLPNGLFNSNTYAFYLDGSTGASLNANTFFSNSSQSFRAINGYSNMWYVPCSNLAYSNNPYTIRSWYQNYSTQPIRVFSNLWNYSNTSMFSGAPYNVYFTTADDGYPADC